MMSNITRDEISEYIYREFGLTKIDCNEFVNELINLLIEGLRTEKSIKIHNFGTFKIKEKKERIGRNPKTKEPFVISARNVINFTPSKNILDFINLNLDEPKKL